MHFGIVLNLIVKQFIYRPSRSRHIQTRVVQESSRETSKHQADTPEALRGKLQVHLYLLRAK